MELIKKKKTVTVTSEDPAEVLPIKSPSTGEAVSANVSRFLRLPEVVSLTGLSASTIKRKIKKGTFPRPRRLSDQAVGFREKDIHDWMSAREEV